MESAPRRTPTPPMRPRTAGYFFGQPLYRLRSAMNTTGEETKLSPVFLQISSVETLERAWQSVLARDAQDGVLQRQSKRIIENADEFLNQLSALLRNGTYEPEPLNRVDIPKGEHGKTRTLNIPTIHDRIVERAIVDTIAFTADLVQSSCSFAYRTGIGVDDAVHHVATLREEGYQYVLRTDIEDFFPHVNLEHALEALPESLQERDLLALLRIVALPRRAHGQRRARSRGVAQGSTLSPLLANLSLTRFDHDICDAGYGYARFADDIVVCSPREQDILDAIELLSDLAAAHGLKLNQDKTIMTTFDEGFCYLGVDFTRTRPDADPYHDIKGQPDPDHVVYVGRDGARVHVTKGRLIVDGADGLPQMSIPQRSVSRIVLTGSVGLSAGARSWALYNDIDVLCLSRRGTYLGQLAGPRSTVNARRLLAQAAFSDDEEQRLPLARSIVKAKLRNQVHVLNRIGRRDARTDVKSAAQELRNLAEELTHADSINEIMGLEGAASTDYYTALSSLVPEDVAFQGRSRRPPRDLANAALSYCYAILLGECTGALFAAGLEPSLGILHSSTDKRPSLSLDLMEEFRPLLVDSTVMALLRTHRLRPEHATSAPGDEDGVWLNREGKKIVVDGYEATMQRHVKGALPGFTGTWRRHIHHEAQLLGRAIMEPDYTWTGVAWR